MTQRVYREDEPRAIGEAFDRIRILEAVVQTNGPPGPYNTYSVITDGTGMADVILAEPGRVFGWNYHNENDVTVYFGIYDMDTNPSGGNDPVIQLGAPPEGGSGHMFNSAGVVFATGIAFYVKLEMFSTGSPTFPAADTATCDVFWLPETAIV